MEGSQRNGTMTAITRENEQRFSNFLVRQGGFSPPGPTLWILSYLRTVGHFTLSQGKDTSQYARTFNIHGMHLLRLLKGRLIRRRAGNGGEAVGTPH